MESDSLARSDGIIMSLGRTLLKLGICSIRQRGRTECDFILFSYVCLATVQVNFRPWTFPKIFLALRSVVSPWNTVEISAFASSLSQNLRYGAVISFEIHAIDLLPRICFDFHVSRAFYEVSIPFWYGLFTLMAFARQGNSLGKLGSPSLFTILPSTYTL